MLTFDDAVKSHRTFVAPLLKELGFGATFFVTHRWMNESDHFMSWQDIAEIHRMGFEIGNHSWTHANFSIPKNAARLAAELALVEHELKKVGVPRPISFAYSGNGFGPEAVRQLEKVGYRFARRGMQPEIPYGTVAVGPSLEPDKHHRLLIPTTGDAYPSWTLEHFQHVVAPARQGKIVVLQFHGVPDVAHPWVHSPPERFREYMTHLKQNSFRVIALRDLESYLPNRHPDDPLLDIRYPEAKGPLELPGEMTATQTELDFWLKNMLVYHRFSWEETADVSGLEVEVLKRRARELSLGIDAVPQREQEMVVLPYPGGRHPRIGFLEGAVNPVRGTKASVFLPWDPAAYLVVDLPEAIFVEQDLLFLAHTHLPTLWNKQNIWLDDIEWSRPSLHSLSSTRSLPNGATFGASVKGVEDRVELELWLRNGSAEPLRQLRAQVCLMLKGAPDFAAQTNDNKIFKSRTAAVNAAKSDRWILTAWEQSGRTWGNSNVPCLHSDPLLPDCAPGETVRARGSIWFYEGNQIESQIQ